MGKLTKPYTPRVILDVDSILDNDTGCSIIVLHNNVLDILRQLSQYARRPINWCAVKQSDGWYEQPDDTQWNEIDAIVSDMEESLMNVCDLESLIEKLDDLCTCIPASIQAVQQQTLNGVNLYPAMEQGNVTVIAPTLDTEGDEGACQVAQTWWAMAYEYWTEVCDPLADTYDKIIVLLFGFFMTVAAPVMNWVVGLGITLSAVTAFFDIFYSNTSANLINYLFSQKHDLICRAYRGMAEEPANTDELDAFIDASTESASVKFALHGMVNAFMPIAQICKDTAWSVARQEEGYCDDCLALTCYDFNDPDWTITELGEITEEGWLHIISPGVGLPEVASRVWAGFSEGEAVSWNLAFYARGSLEEEHQPFVVTYTWHDAAHNPVKTYSWTGVFFDDDWHLVEPDAGTSTDAEHVHVVVKGVTMTDAWIQYMCVSEVE